MNRLISAKSLLSFTSQIRRLSGMKQSFVLLQNKKLPAPLLSFSDLAGPVDINFPNYKERHDEGLDDLKARLVYQSRKRGTLEIGLLLSSFASKYLSTMNSSQLHEYDQLINKPGNEWDLYYWIIGSKTVPDEFNNPTMTLLKKFAKNEEKVLRITQPALEEKPE